jgi:hypothetical protein
MTAYSQESSWLGQKSAHGIQGSDCVFAFTFVTPSSVIRFMPVLQQPPEGSAAVIPMLVVNGHDTVDFFLRNLYPLDPPLNCPQILLLYFIMAPLLFHRLGLHNSRCSLLRDIQNYFK